MASPMMPPLPPRLPHRSIAAPVVLILMGVLFLLGTMGIMDIHHLGSLFARFWPALLILWGVLKLIEYEQAKRLGQPARGIGVGGVFLMLFLIVAGLIATQISRVDWKSLGDHLQLGDDQGLDEIFGGSTFNTAVNSAMTGPRAATVCASMTSGARSLSMCRTTRSSRFRGARRFTRKISRTLTAITPRPIQRLPRRTKLSC